MTYPPYTHDALTDWEPILEHNKPEEQVTVAIAVLAEGGSMAIIGSDLRATFPKLQPNETTGKAWKFPKPFNCGIAAAGILRDCQPYVDHLWEAFHRLGKLETIPNDYLEAAIDDARFRVLRRRSDWAMRKKYRITLKQWHNGKVPGGKLDPLLLKAGEILLEGVKFQAQSIIAGFIRGRSIFYKTDFMNDVECSSTPGVYAIGIGAPLAMNHLNKRDQNAGCSFARSLLHVSEALDVARKDPSGTVGKASRFMVMADDGSLVAIMPDHPTLLGWKRVYARRGSTTSLQSCKLADIQAKGMTRIVEGRND